MQKDHQSQTKFQKPRHMALNLPTEDPFGIHLKILWRTEGWRKCWDVLRDTELMHPLHVPDPVPVPAAERYREKSAHASSVFFLPVWKIAETGRSDIQIRRYEQGQESSTTMPVWQTSCGREILETILV